MLHEEYYGSDWDLFMNIISKPDNISKFKPGEYVVSQASLLVYEVMHQSGKYATIRSLLEDKEYTISYNSHNIFININELTDEQKAELRAATKESINKWKKAKEKNRRDKGLDVS